VENVEVYHRGRARFVALVRGLDADALASPVPATPPWTVLDVVRHLTGVAADVSAGNVAGAPGDEWTAAQVAARQGRSLDELLAEWDAALPALEAIVPHVPQLPIDVLTHEQDIRGAVGLPDADHELLEFAVAGLSAFQAKMASNAELAPAPVTAPSGFEHFRAALGRRSRAQVAAWDWDQDPTPWLDSAFFVFGPRADDLVEQDPLRSRD
jgi:uncharacterized protein (TIGR03083 family)